MHAPYSLETVESRFDCKLRPEGFFCDLPREALEAFEAIKRTGIYSKGALLFIEGHTPRGIYLLCQGRVKLSICSSEGKMRILRIAAAGEVLGLSATVSELPYEVTAETLEPCQASFIEREDFLRFLQEHGEASFRVAQHLSQNYQHAYVQIRSLGLSQSAGEKLARLLLDWCLTGGQQTEAGIRLKLALTHEEVARMIGTSRETVSRLISDFRSREIIHLKGSDLLVRNKAALEAMVST